MKKIINAMNGAIEFDQDEDVEILSCYIDAKNTYVDVGGEFARIKPFDQIMAIHVFGKNTIASPQIHLYTQLCEFQSWPEVLTDESPLTNDGPVGLLVGQADVNYLYRYNNCFNVLYGIHPQSIMRMKIHTSSTFTGWLHVNVYVKRNSR